MKRFGRVATCLLAAALSAVFAVSGYQIWAILQERQAAEASYQELDSFCSSAEAIPAPDSPGRTAPQP